MSHDQEAGATTTTLARIAKRTGKRLVRTERMEADQNYSGIRD